MRDTSDEQATSLSIQEKIAQAHRLHAACGDSLRQDASIQALLMRLKQKIEVVRKTMLALGIVAECKHCEEEEGGSCCGTGIEDRYDPVLLLINLLLGASLPTQVRGGNSCYFLREKGCMLAARHVLCVNYICQKLQKKLTREELIDLQSCAGEELDTEFILHEAIKKHIRTQHP